MLGNLVLGYLDSMRELASEGKSGSLFYLTPNGNYFVKTIKKGEFKIMWQGLQGYYEHLKRNTNSLIYKYAVPNTKSNWFVLSGHIRQRQEN